MTTAKGQGLPPRTLAGILAAIVVLIVGAAIATRKPGPAGTPEPAVPDTRHPAPGTSEGHFDSELYRGSISFLEAAVYRNAGVERLPEGAHTLAQAVMAKNAANPLVRPLVLALETRLDRLAQLGGNSPEAVQAWEAIRREYFTPASWLHAPAAPAPQ